MTADTDAAAAAAASVTFRNMPLPLSLVLLLLCGSAKGFLVVPHLPLRAHGTKTAMIGIRLEAASGIQAALKERMKAAMKGGAERKKELAAVRLMVSAMTTKQKEDGMEGDLDDESAQAVLSKLAKMRKESIEMFEKGGNTEAADAERAELAILDEYLPAAADETTVRGWIAEAIAEVCPDGPDKKLMGKVSVCAHYSSQLHMSHSHTLPFHAVSNRR